mmetsp:Transcript_1366/g.1789  ORF Transcript_1366/g.1789 Transcript_1366/m.1789 type:complete len:205 (+) Transcript_1366:121-735(+)
MVRHLVVDVLEQVIDSGKLLGGGSLEGISGFVTGLLSHLALIVLGDDVFLQHVGFDTGDGVLDLIQKVGPLGHFLVVSVGLGEVTRGVVSNTVRHGLDKDWALLFNYHLSSSLGSIVDSKEVVSINSNGMHAICKSSSSDTVTGVLVVDGGGDSVHIIPAVEEGLGSESSSEVESGVEVSLGGSSISEISDSESVFLINSELIS